MSALRNYPLKIKNGEKLEFGLRGSMVRVVSASVPIYFRSRDDDMDFYLVEGEQAELKNGALFKNVEIYHNDVAEQNIILAIGENAVIGSAKVSGSVTISNKDALQGAFTQGRVSLTNVNQAIIAANANRRYLLIQNNDLAQVMRFTLDGSAATAAAGFRIIAGGVFELKGYQASGAINAIMEAATAAAGNVEFSEG